MEAGELVVVVYAPDHLAADDGGPQPGFKAKEAAEGEEKSGKDAQPETPKWAASQYERIREMLERESAGAAAAAPGTDDVHGTGTGLAGEGKGGGGTGVGIGTGTSGTGIGAATDATSQGRGRAGDRPAATERPRDRARPDKVVLWMGRHGPMLNVWVGASAEAIPLKPGEDDASLKKRVEESAARQTSTGTRLANGATETGFVGGKGGHVPTPDELAGMTEATANARAYPSRIEMQGGSGAEVSPRGWGTTITGAEHNFDMILDWDAIVFGFSNQVWARMQPISYYWQVIDVSKLGFEREQRKDESAEDYQRRMRVAAAVSVNQDPDNARKVGKFEGFKADVGRTARIARESIDNPEFSMSDSPTEWGNKASVLSIEALSATWDMAKGLVSAWITKMTEPENRRKVEFGTPGEYLVRCLANPVEVGDIPESRRIHRATSVGVFPVRVLDVNARGAEVNRHEETEIADLKTALAAAQAELAKDDRDAGVQTTVAMLSDELGRKEKAAARTSSQRIADDVQSYQVELQALHWLLAHDGSTEGLSGSVLATALWVKRQLGLTVSWQWENRIQDVEKALDEKKDQSETATKWAQKVTTEIRPRVTFVSEENGAVIQMEMILGQAKGENQEHPDWMLMDVTSPKTQGKYEGTSSTPGAHGEAITNAFQDFADKAEYGRGTLAIEIPELPATTMIKGGVPPSMLMKPGKLGLWRHRLENLMEIASLVTPFAGEAAMIGRVAMVAGALDAGYRLYDRAKNERLHADFATVTDLVAVFTPLLEGAGAIGELEGMSKTTTGFALRTAARSGQVANEFLLPASVFHDIEQVIGDPGMDGPAKQAAIAMILGRGLRDGAIQHHQLLGFGGERPVEEAPRAGEVPGERLPATGPTAEHGETTGRPEAGESTAGGPEATSTKGRRARHDGGDETAAVPEEAADEPGKPKAGRKAEDLGIRPGSELDTPRGRRNREEQARRAAENPVDALAIRRGTAPDARARAAAADFTPLFAEWAGLAPPERQARVEAAINGRLVAEGIPPITVEVGAKAPGSAAFRFQEWRIHMSEETFAARTISEEDFAQLVDNAVHEGRHALHHFRGLRAALAEGRYDPSVTIPETIVDAARTANKRRPPLRDMSPEAYHEALEVYEITHEAGRRRAELGTEAVVDRRAVLDRKDSAKAVRDFLRDEIARLRKEGKESSDEFAEAQKNLHDAELEFQAAHNDYVALPQETDAWRAGSAARAAVLERLKIQDRLTKALDAKAAAAAEQRAANERGDHEAADAALGKYRAAVGDARAAQAELDGLTSKSPKLVGGRLTTHEVPVGGSGPTSPPAPTARKRTSADAGGSKQAVDEEASEPVESPAIGARTAGTETPAPAAGEGAQSAEKKRWAGRTVGSDVPAGGVEPSVGEGVTYEKRPENRYTEVGKPASGSSESVILLDRTTNRKYLFKPGKGEKPVPHAEARGVEAGQYAPRAKAAEIASTALGIETPGVELVQIGDRTGSLTEWIEPENQQKPETMSLADYLRPTEKTTDAEADARLRDLQSDPAFRTAWDGIQALDFLINNVDRVQNFGNYMIEFTSDGRFKNLQPIDSELSFTSTSERAVIEKKTTFLESITYTPELVTKLMDLGARRSEFAEQIRPLVGDQAVEGVLHRLDQLILDAVKRGPRPAGRKR